MKLAPLSLLAAALWLLAPAAAEAFPHPGRLPGAPDAYRPHRPPAPPGYRPHRAPRPPGYYRHHRAPVPPIPRPGRLPRP